MTDHPHHEQPTDESDNASEPPAIHQREGTDKGPLGPDDTDTGPEGKLPDPDEYAGADDH